MNELEMFQKAFNSYYFAICMTNHLKNTTIFGNDATTLIWSPELFQVINLVNLFKLSSESSIFWSEHRFISTQWQLYRLYIQKENIKE